ncbi:MAG: ROK family protein [Actinomycetota bacterium]|nr:ROK family protein [Actinomycetota bacterium]
MSSPTGGRSPGRPQSIRAMNERLLLEHIRRIGEISRADLARTTGLSKPTVSLTLANLERTGLVRSAGLRTGAPGPAAVLYELRPDVGHVLALDVGQRFLRGSISDIAGAVCATSTVRARATTGRGRVAELVRLAESLCSTAGLGRDDLTQTVLGSPGVYDPQQDAITLAPALNGWERPEVLTALRAAFGATLMIENDVDAAALAEQAHGHGRGVDSFAFVSVGTGIGMGLVLGGELLRGAHGAAGEIGYLPFEIAEPDDAEDAGRRGRLEATASGDGITRAAQRAGLGSGLSAREVFAAANNGDRRAVGVVAAEAYLVARAICAVVAVADPELVVLGGGIGRAAGFVDAVRIELERIAPVLPELQVSAVGDAAVIDGCLAAGLERAWERLTSALSGQALPATKI